VGALMPVIYKVCPPVPHFKMNSVRQGIFNKQILYWTFSALTG